jgi:hypothetical protein
MCSRSCLGTWKRHHRCCFLVLNATNSRIEEYNIDRTPYSSFQTLLLAALPSATSPKMKSVMKFVLAICLRAIFVLAEGELTGFPANPYDPYCAMACLRSFSSLMLDCSDGGESVGMHAIMTSSTCWASNTPYLTSLAWCMHDKCSEELEIPNSKLEAFWESDATGQQSAGVKTVKPKWSYAEALAEVKGKPTIQLTSEGMDLNATALVAPDVYKAQYNVLFSIQREVTVENGYG